ncbi:hypothetical protein FRC19_005091 [Serendipita sp. 401]|nr:hypothetical protein FRC19_005091 [Serendipita sp. 401]
MSTLPTNQGLQGDGLLEMGESSWEPHQPNQQSGHPNFDQESREGGSLYTNIQFGSDYPTQNPHTHRDVATISNLYGVQGPIAVQGPDVISHSIAPYLAKIPTPSRYDPASTPRTENAVFLPTGVLQPDGTLESLYCSPTTDELPPFEGFPNMNTNITRQSGNHPMPPTNMTPQPAEQLETAENEEECQETVALLYSGGGAWKCAICSKSFRRRRRAVLHVLNKHNNIRIPCKGLCGTADCDKSFAAQEGLDIHIRPVTVECSSCGKSMLKKNLHRHSKLHCPQGSTGMPGG